MVAGTKRVAVQERASSEEAGYSHICAGYWQQTSSPCQHMEKLGL